MNQCTTCKATSIDRGVFPHALTLASGVGDAEPVDREFTAAVPGFRCAKCGETFLDLEGLRLFDVLVTRWLVANGYASGDELRFVRKAAGLRAADVAEALGVSLQTVSSWETGKHPADATTRQTIGALALDALDGTTTTRDRLRAMRAPIAKTQVRLDERSTTAAELRATLTGRVDLGPDAFSGFRANHAAPLRGRPQPA